MLQDVDSTFDAALALPPPIRADLAARLLESLEDELTPPADHTPDERLAIIEARSNTIESGQAKLIDGQIIADKLQAIIDKAGRKS